MVSSDDDRVIFRKAKIEIDYENPDNAWKSIPLSLRIFEGTSIIPL